MKQKPKHDKSITFFENSTKTNEPPLRKMRKFRNLEQIDEEIYQTSPRTSSIEREITQTKRRYSANIDSKYKLQKIETYNFSEQNNSSECSSMLEDMNSFTTSEIDSNRSDGMSQADIDFDKNYDELSELWDQSSIDTQNSQQSGQKRILRYMHIKSLSDDDSQEYCIRTKEMILPVFEQLEQQSQRLQPLVNLKVSAPTCSNTQVHHEKEEADCFFHGHNGIEGDDCPNIMRDPTSVRSGRRLKLNKIRRKMKIQETLQGQEDRGGGGLNETNNISVVNSVPIASIPNQLDIPPVTVYDAFIRLSFNLMDQQVRESAQQRALLYLSHIPRDSSRFNEVFNMVSEVYRVMILPDEVLMMYTNGLSSEQKKIEALEIIKNINPRLNKHHFKQQAIEKIRRHYLI